MSIKIYYRKYEKRRKKLLKAKEWWEDETENPADNNTSTYHWPPKKRIVFQTDIPRPGFRALPSLFKMKFISNHIYIYLVWHTSIFKHRKCSILGYTGIFRRSSDSSIK